MLKNLTNFSYEMNTDSLLDIMCGNADEDVAYAEGLLFVKTMVDLLSYPSKHIGEGNSSSDFKEAYKKSQEAEYFFSQGKVLFRHYPLIVEFIDNVNRLSYFSKFDIISHKFDLIRSENAAKISTYFIKNNLTGLVKIGKSNNVEDRVKALSGPAGCKLEILAIVSEDVETKLHHKFKHLRVHSEWFSPGEELLEYIDSIKAYTNQK